MWAYLTTGIAVFGLMVLVGLAMRMVFRIKDYDSQRGFTRYFWKATPAGAAKEA